MRSSTASVLPGHPKTGFPYTPFLTVQVELDQEMKQQIGVCYKI